MKLNHVHGTQKWHVTLSEAYPPSSAGQMAHNELAAEPWVDPVVEPSAEMAEMVQPAAVLAVQSQL